MHEVDYERRHNFMILYKGGDDDVVNVIEKVLKEFEN